MRSWKRDEGISGNDWQSHGTLGRLRRSGWRGSIGRSGFEGGADGGLGYAGDANVLERGGVAGDDVDVAFAEVQLFGEEGAECGVGLSFFRGCSDGDAEAAFPEAEDAGAGCAGDNFDGQNDGIYFGAQCQHVQFPVGYRTADARRDQWAWIVD